MEKSPCISNEMLTYDSVRLWAYLLKYGSVDLDAMGYQELCKEFSCTKAEIDERLNFLIAGKNFVALTWNDNPDIEAWRVEGILPDDMPFPSVFLGMAPR